MTAETVKENAIIFGIIEEKKYTASDLKQFAEWCKRKWTIEFFPETNDWKGYNVETHEWEIKTTSQLREMWETETGRKEVK